MRCLDHTQIRTYTRYDSSERVTSSSHNTQQPQDEHPFSQRDSNQPSKQLSGLKPTPQTARPLESAFFLIFPSISRHTCW